MSIIPGQYDSWEIYRGATFSTTLTYRDSSNALVDLTGYTARLQLKSSRSLDAAALITLTSGSGITLGGAAGTIAIVITDEQTATLAAGTVYYSVLLIPGSGAAFHLLEGKMTVKEGVTGQ